MVLIAKRLREIDFPHETFRVPVGAGRRGRRPLRRGNAGRRAITQGFAQT